VIGGDLVLAHGSGDDDGFDTCSVVESFLREVEVKFHESGCRSGIGGEGAAEDGGGGRTAKVGEEGVHHGGLVEWSLVTVRTLTVGVGTS